MPNDQPSLHSIRYAYGLDMKIGNPKQRLSEQEHRYDALHIEDVELEWANLHL